MYTTLANGRNTEKEICKEIKDDSEVRVEAQE